MLFDLSRIQGFFSRVRQGTDLPFNKNGAILVSKADGCISAHITAVSICPMPTVQCGGSSSTLKDLFHA